MGVSAGVTDVYNCCKNNPERTNKKKYSLKNNASTRMFVSNKTILEKSE